MARFLNPAAIESLLPMGGVRLSENVVITEAGLQRLVSLPRTVQEVEAVMSGAEWSLEAATSPVAQDSQSRFGPFALGWQGLNLVPQ